MARPTHCVGNHKYSEHVSDTKQLIRVLENAGKDRGKQYTCIRQLDMMLQKPVGVHVAIYCAADSRYSMKPSDFH